MHLIVIGSLEALWQLKTAWINHGTSPVTFELVADIPDANSTGPAADIVVLSDDISAHRVIELSHQIRAPIVIFAERNQPCDIAALLEAGATDVVTEFRSQEALARLRAIHRRTATNHHPESVDDKSVEVTVGNITVSRRTHSVVVGSRELALPLKQFLLLQTLMSSPNQVVSREALISELWTYVGNTQRKTLDVLVHRLRSTLATVPEAGIEILTVRGAGFRLGTAPTRQPHRTGRTTTPSRLSRR